MQEARRLRHFGGMGAAALLFVLMGSFSYQFGANPPIDYVRLMIADTAEFAPDGVTPIYVFADQEIQAMTLIVQQLTWQSSQFYTPPGGMDPPNLPVPWLRIAAGLIDCMVANSAKLSAISKILDVELAPGKAAQWLREQAKAYRDADDNSGAFLIVEQVNNIWSLEQRYWKQVQREQGLNF